MLLSSNSRNSDLHWFSTSEPRVCNTVSGPETPVFQTGVSGVLLHRPETPVLHTGDSGGSSSRPRRLGKQLLHYNEESDTFVDAATKKRQSKDAAFVEQEKIRVAKEERAKKAKYDHLQTLKGISKDEFRALRLTQFYDLDRTSTDPHFHRKEQQVFMKEIYETLQTQVCPQQYMNFEYMQKYDYFSEALMITEKLGLHHLMKIKEDYNVKLVQQFYATVVFAKDEERTMTWMTGTTRCSADFYQFASALELPFDGASNAVGHRMHDDSLGYHKKKLAPLYGDDAEFGKAKGLRILYNLLLRIFRHTISPSAGNDDDLRGGLVNLLIHSHKIALQGPEADEFEIDVMDFIFQEMYHAIQWKKSPPYAPYVMRLINTQEHDSPLNQEPHLVTHTDVSLQKKGKMSPPEFETAQDDDVDEVMANVERRTTRHGSRRKNASNVPMPEADTPEVIKKKFSIASFWKQKFCCMNVDIRHGQHQQYVRDRKMMKMMKDIKAQGQEEPARDDEEESSSGTYSFGKWNRMQNSLTDWQAFSDATSDFRPHGKSNREDDDDDYQSGDGEDDDEEE